MSRGKELVKNTAIVAIGKVCTKFLSFFLLPFYTAVLSTEDYGIVDLFNTYISLLLPVVVFQIEDALFRFLIDVRERQEEKKKIISTVFWFCTGQSIIFSLLCGLVLRFFPIEYGGYLLCNVVISIFAGSFLQLTRGLGDNASYAFASFLNALVAIALNILLVLFLQMGASGLFITAFLANLVTVVYVTCKMKVYRWIQLSAFDRIYLKDMLAYSLPMIPNSLSWWVIGASDKSVVNWFLGVSQNGILSVAQKFSAAYTTFYSIFALTWTENASVYSKENDRATYYSQIVETSFRIFSSVCLGIIAVMPLAFSFLVNEKFGESYYQIPIYMLSSLLYTTIGLFSVVYIADKHTDKIAKTSMFAAAINLFVNLVLIRHIGLYAASISSVVAYAVLLLVRYVDIQKQIRIRIGKWTLLSVVILMAVDFVVYYIRDPWLCICNLIMVIISCLWMNRQFLHLMLTELRQRIDK